MSRYYTGVGSRQTPESLCRMFSEIAHRLQSLGYVVRTGDAIGADAAFRVATNHVCFTMRDATEESLIMAAKYHPAWNACSAGARKLHARNCQQVLGKNLNDPSKFLICWTKNGSGQGGTGQAIRVAKAYSIPVFDFGLPIKNVGEKLYEHLKYLSVYPQITNLPKG